MIERIKDKSLKLLYEKGDGSKIRPDLLRKIENILTRLQAIKEIRDMNAPGLKSHRLKGERKGTWSVTFKFAYGDAYDVKLEDYH